MEHTFDPDLDPTLDPACLVDLPSERLEAEICSTAAHLAAAACRFLVLVAEFDRRQGFESWECLSTAHWLNWKCGLGMNAAREQVRVARRLNDLPLVRAAFAEGRLSYSKVRAVSRVAHPAIEADLVNMAEYATAQQMEQACGALRRCQDVREAEEDLRSAERHGRDRAHVDLSRESDGSLTARIRLGPEEADIVRRALTTAIEAVTAGHPDDGDRPALAWLRAEALAEMARAYLARPDTGPGPQPEIVVHVESAALQPPPGPSAETPTRPQDPLERHWRWPVQTGSGTALSLATLARLASDAGIRWVADLPDGSVLDLGRHARVPNAAMMRALQARDGQCRFPGCSSRHRLHAHHIVWWIHGGPTTLDNLILLCRKHHHAVHDRRWTCAGTAAEPTFARPDGTVVDTRTPNRAGNYTELVVAHERYGLDVAVDSPGGRWEGDRIDWDCFFAAFAVPSAQAGQQLEDLTFATSER